MTTTHEIEIDTAGRSAAEPVKRGVRKSWTPWCRCGWQSATSYPNSVAAALAATAHANG